jgi:S1/P1 Nuclease
MLVAYIAYRNLTAQTRSRVDKLLRLNPMYAQWTEGVTQDRRGVVAFIYAATWPDCIKQPVCSPGYTSDGGDIPPGNASDTQNIGYPDKLMHRYWHFIDIPFEAGARGRPPRTPNALTEIVLLIKAIRMHEPDDIKSYDIAWLEHLVGDVHQPLHCTSRFTANHPYGDAGGNYLQFCQKPCKDALHAYWDGLLGDRPSFVEVSQTLGLYLE